MPPRGGGGGARGGGGGGRGGGGGGWRGGGGGRHRHHGHHRRNGFGVGFWGGGPWWGPDYYDCVRDPYAPWRCLPPYAALWGSDAGEAAAAPTAPPPPAKPGILANRTVQLGLAAAAGYFIGKGKLF